MHAVIAAAAVLLCATATASASFIPIAQPILVKKVVALPIVKPILIKKLVAVPLVKKVLVKVPVFQKTIVEPVLAKDIHALPLVESVKSVDKFVDKVDAFDVVDDLKLKGLH
jgi:hypothetical protein